MFETWPRLLEGHPRFPAYVDWQVVLVGHAVPAPHRLGLLDLAEHALQGLAVDPDAYYYLAGTVPGPPDEVAVVAAYGPWQPVLWAEEVYGARLAVVTGEYASAFSLSSAGNPS